MHNGMKQIKSENGFSPIKVCIHRFLCFLLFRPLHGVGRQGCTHHSSYTNASVNTVMHFSDFMNR
jgi:hypothetical protein